MVMSRIHKFVLIAVALSCLGTVLAGPQPGPIFPFFDSCRRTQDHQLRNLTALTPKSNADGSVEFCFRVNVINDACQPEAFFLRKTKVISRCCNTTFAKIKFYANSACKNQFMPSKLTVPMAPTYNKIVSPVWEHLNTNWTSVKYTQFGPIPQDLVDGTTFCLKIAKPAGINKCAQTISSIVNPVILKGGNFVSLYDRKTNDYECCPTFPLPSQTGKITHKLQAHRRH